MVLTAAMALSACGSDSDSGNNEPSISDVAVRISDAPVDGASNVVITVDSMTFRHENGDDIIVETFTSDELGLQDEETFTIDLLEVQGSENRLVLDSVALPVGNYTDLRLEVIDEDINVTYVVESDGGIRKELKVPSGDLRLGSFEVSALSTQTFVIEFGLRQSMTYNPGPDRYILKPHGVRIVDLEAASAISGTVELTTAHMNEACSSNTNLTISNVVYVYTGHELETGTLADNVDPEAVDAGVIDGLNLPIASPAIDDSGTFEVAYLPPGDYTIAFSCLAADDNSDQLDNFTIPAPQSYTVEVFAPAGGNVECIFNGGGEPFCAITTEEPEDNDIEESEEEETE